MGTSVDLMGISGARVAAACDRCLQVNDKAYRIQSQTSPSSSPGPAFSGFVTQWSQLGSQLQPLAPESFCPSSGNLSPGLLSCCPGGQVHPQLEQVSHLSPSCH